MTTGKLPDHQRAGSVRKVAVQEGLEPDEIQFFAGTDGCRVVLDIEFRSVRRHRKNLSPQRAQRTQRKQK